MMGKFSMEFDTDNAAFLDDPDEVVRVIGQVANKLDRHDKREDTNGAVRDVNGNTVGRWHWWADR